jgi:DNA-binding NarL/FixJ family response regulator
MRVLLAEDHNLVRQGTRLYLQSEGIEIVGEATNGREAVEMARALRPDVVVLDIHMPELTGIEAARRIHHELPETRLLILSAYDQPAYVSALLEAGADGYVLKTAELSQLLTALREVAQGHSAFDPALMHNTASALTERERDVLLQAAHGLTNKQIGAALFISDRTVQGHLQSIYAKLNVTTRTEAVTTALAQGWIKLD